MAVRRGRINGGGWQRGLPGGGPWRIKQECKAINHNAWRSAARGPRETRCICPRGMDLAKQERRDRKQREREPSLAPRVRRYAGDGTNRVVSGNPWASVEGAAYMNNDTRRVEAPDHSRGLCTSTASGRVAAMLVFDQPGSASGARMRRICDNCPIRPECQRWVLSNETPAGSWGGMYGGLSVSERQKIAEQREVAGDAA